MWWSTYDHMWLTIMWGSYILKASPKNDLKWPKNDLHFFRKFFLAEKAAVPQTFSLFECLVRISIIFSWKLKHHISSTFGPRLVGLQTTYIWCCVFYALCIICGTWSCDDQHHILLKTFGPRLALAPGLQTTGGCLHTFHSVALICTRFVHILLDTGTFAPDLNKI